MKMVENRLLQVVMGSLACRVALCDGGSTASGAMVLGSSACRVALCGVGSTASGGVGVISIQSGALLTAGGGLSFTFYTATPQFM